MEMHYTDLHLEGGGMTVVPGKLAPAINGHRHDKTCLYLMRTTKVQISLISTCVVRCLDSIISLVSIFACSRF